MSMNSFKPISISLSPNTEKDDILLALKMLFRPGDWKEEKNNGSFAIEKEFKRYLGVKHAFSFNSGRSALMAILSSFSFAKGDEILLQSFTCNAAANPIIWSGFNPVFVDCDEKTFNVDIEDLKRKIGPKSKIVMVQHTFGLPADMEEILEICREKNLILIEDCAHSLGASYCNKKTGTFGKAAFFSFSRDKIISSVYGGMAVTDDDDLAGKIKEYREKIGYPPNYWIFQQLLHPVLMNYVILPTYSVFGKYLLFLLQKIQILSKAVHWKEKRGRKPGYFPKKLPNALAILALNQFKKIEKFNNHRKKIADFYYQELKNTNFELVSEREERKNIFLRFTVKHPNAHKIIQKAWQKNILIGDWYTTAIAPHDTKLEKVKYIKGSCPKAEKLSKKTFNLPTHINISKKTARKIAEFLKTFSCG